MTDPWGIDDPPAAVMLEPLPSRLERLAEVERTGVGITDVDPYAWPFPAADELPEVIALAANGWRPLHPAPLYSLLPAAWPAEHRAWVPDRLPQVSMGATTDKYHGEIEPYLVDDWVDDDDERNAAAAGLPAPPSGRIWLLRSPWPDVPVSAIYGLLWPHVTDGPDAIVGMYSAARELLAGAVEPALAGAPDVRASLAAWAAVGRVGESVTALYESRCTPAEIARLLNRTGLDEDTALAWLAALQVDVDPAGRFIVAWHEAGLPGDPPPGADRFSEREPAELASWLAAGFDLYAADRLERAGLPTASAWRDQGFSSADTYELLRSDPDLTPDEALAFDALGVDRANRQEWVYLGFSAAEAAAWQAAGSSPDDARFERSEGRGPGGAEPDDSHLGLVGNVGLDGITYYSHNDFMTRGSSVTDPPGTRGRAARRAAGDDDPWINTD